MNYVVFAWFGKALYMANELKAKPITKKWSQLVDISNVGKKEFSQRTSNVVGLLDHRLRCYYGCITVGEK